MVGWGRENATMATKNGDLAGIGRGDGVLGWDRSRMRDAGQPGTRLAGPAQPLGLGAPQANGERSEPLDETS